MQKRNFSKKNNKPKDFRSHVDLKKQLKSVDVGIKNGVFIFSEALTITEFAKKINKLSSDLIKYFFLKGKVVTANQLLTIEEIGEICLENNLDFKIEKEISDENILDNITFNDDQKDLVTRPPIVTIMGHVDHGKTTLLDKIRSASVVSGEAGGITQHIGAYQTSYNDRPITFIDTPGHEAFSDMRARGANVTDIVIIVVAADDGMKPQTEEAIDHAKASKSPIIVFVNKMDKVGANPEKVMSQLSERDLISEEWGGDTIFVKGSALNGDGLDNLLKAILASAEMLSIKANPNRLAYGTIIESKLDKGLGPVATLLLINGSLKKGDFLVAGSSYGRVRLMYDENNHEVAVAGPSKPVIISGLESVPIAGEKFLCVKDEKKAKEIAQTVKNKKIKSERFKQLNTDLRTKIASGEIKNINIILKADTHGSLEAVKGVMQKLNVDGATSSLIRSAIGSISESDIRLAQASEAMIIGFNIRPTKAITTVAENANVPILTFEIIYKLKEELENLLKGSLDPIFVEKVIGELDVQQIWKHSDVGTICGCKVTSGKVLRNSLCRIIRDGVVIYSSNILSMKHGKNQISECTEGKECGVTINNFNDVKENDIIEIYENVETDRDAK